jgi:hypothetical protein
MARLKASVYGFYAGNDARIGATLPDAIQQMKAAGKSFEPVTYEVLATVSCARAKLPTPTARLAQTPGYVGKLSLKKPPKARHRRPCCFGRPAVAWMFSLLRRL